MCLMIDKEMIKKFRCAFMIKIIMDKYLNGISFLLKKKAQFLLSGNKKTFLINSEFLNQRKF